MAKTRAQRKAERRRRAAQQARAAAEGKAPPAEAEAQHDTQVPESANVAEAELAERGAVTGFIASCWAELKRVQWPDRETLIQASAITLIFIAIMAAYLGVLDAAFNWLVQRIL